MFALKRAYVRLGPFQNNTINCYNFVQFFLNFRNVKSGVVEEGEGELRIFSPYTKKMQVVDDI